MSGARLQIQKQLVTGLQTENQGMHTHFTDRRADQVLHADTGRQKDKDSQNTGFREGQGAESGAHIEAGQKSSPKHSSHWHYSTLSNSDKFKGI